jgi:hypothetical protein
MNDGDMKPMNKWRDTDGACDTHLCLDEVGIMAIAKFRLALLAHGLEPGEIAPDGVIRRCSSNGSGQDKASYYALFDNGGGVLCGVFGDWRAGLKETWISTQAKP